HPPSRRPGPDPRRRRGIACVRRPAGTRRRSGPECDTGRRESLMSTNTMHIVAVTTSLSEDSTTLKLTDRVLASAASAGESVGIDVTTDVINVRSLATALTDMTLTGFRS